MKTVVKKKENFTTIHNNLILDESISWKAKGILIYMLSKPAGWKYKSSEIAKNATDGRDSVRNGLKELVENGYISRQKNSDGSLTYYIFEDKRQIYKNLRRKTQSWIIRLWKSLRRKTQSWKTQSWKTQSWIIRSYIKERILIIKE